MVFISVIASSNYDAFYEFESLYIGCFMSSEITEIFISECKNISWLCLGLVVLGNLRLQFNSFKIFSLNVTILLSKILTENRFFSLYKNMHFNIFYL